MSHLLLLTTSTQSSAEVLPAFARLPHNVKILPGEPGILDDAPPCDAVLIDARTDLPQTRTLSRTLRDTGLDCPLFLIVNDGGLAVVGADWRMDDVIVDTASPAELEARLRLADEKRADEKRADEKRADERLAAEGPAGSGAPSSPDVGGSDVGNSGLVIDDDTFSASIEDRDLDLTYTEFELLRVLTQRPRHTFSREDLLAHIWGADYFAGTRIVDTRIRSLHSKLGTDHRELISCVDDIGYAFIPRDGIRAQDASHIGTSTQKARTCHD